MRLFLYSFFVRVMSLVAQQVMAFLSNFVAKKMKLAPAY